jgi:hypothetical protein
MGKKSGLAEMLAEILFLLSVSNETIANEDEINFPVGGGEYMIFDKT